MRNLVYFLALFLIFINITSISCEKKVVCYYGSWSTYRPGNGKFEVENFDPFLCSHAIYTFVGLSWDGTVRILDSWNEIDRQGFKRFNAMRSTNPNLKTLVAIGGWNEGSSSYSAVMNDDAKRSVFVQDVVAFVLKYEFDGFDLDWEYPCQRGGAASDKEAFVKLLEELRVEFDKLGLILSAAVAAAKPSAEQSYDIPALGKYLDFINIMSYDLHGSWDGVTGHNAPLYAGPNDVTENDKLLNVDACVNYWLSEGAPPEKVILGMGLYGRSFTMTSSSDCGFGLATSGGGNAGPYTREAGMLGYNEICENKWTERWDEQQQVPYACSGNQFVGYDSIESIKIKAQYALQKGLGGGMVWSVETDDFLGICHGYKYPLLTAINQVFSRDITVPEVTPSPSVNPPVTDAPGETDAPGQTDPPTVTVPPTSDGVCNKEGYVRDSVDCSKYYYCQPNGSSYIVYSFHCPSDLWYNEAGFCDWQTNVSC